MPPDSSKKFSRETRQHFQRFFSPPGNEHPATWGEKFRARPWLWILLVLLLFWILPGGEQAGETLAYSSLKEALRQQQVESVTFLGRRIIGHYREQTGKAGGGERFVSQMPALDDPELIPLLEQQGVTIEAEAPEPNLWLQTLVALLPWVLIIGLVVYSSRKMQERMAGPGGIGGLFSFGKSTAKRFDKTSSHVTFDAVAGLENAKLELQEVTDFLKHPETYQALGAKAPKGVLLMGPPGTGKTLLAKAVAGEAEAPFFSISGSEFVEMFVGVGASRVRDMFESAKREAPSIVFIDEIDSVGRVRGSGLGGGHDEREQTLNQILSEMDGFEPGQSIVVIAATNRPDVLDPALLRPGRFDRKLTLELPHREARRQIMQVHARNVPLGTDVDWHNLAIRTVGFSGADLENLVNEAALLAARKKLDRVDQSCLEAARDRIVLGAEQESLLDEEQKKMVAYHESGHALMAALLPHADPLEKVTIIPRGRALGATELLPEEERRSLKRSYLLDRIGVMLGGRVSEKTVFGEVSSGAEDDLKQATQLARRMICQWGMSDSLGAVTFKRGEEHIFLGREMAQQRDFSEHTAKLIDDEIRTLIGAQEDKAESLLKAHRAQLDALARALLEKETLDAAAIQAILQAGGE